MALRLIGTGTTDSNGRISITYTGKGAGKLQLIAKNGSLQSETYEIYDCIYHDEALNSYNDDIWKKTNATLTRASDGTTFSVTEAYGSCWLGTTSSAAQIDISSGICIEYDLIDVSSQDLDVGINFQIQKVSDSGFVPIQTKALGHHKHTIRPNRQIYTVDGQTIHDYSANFGDKVWFGLYGSAADGRYLKYANLKVYPI